MTFHFTAGLPETECGYGSTLKYTEHLRVELPKLLSELEISRLLDAPCGDGNWIAHVDMPWVDYTGCDIRKDHLAKARSRKFKTKTARFINWDLMMPHWLAADAMLCRDFMQHLPNESVRQLLGNFVGSGIPWLLATTHGNESNEDIAEPGMFRPLNLMAAPFSFPPPAASIHEQPDGRSLAAWHRNTVMKCTNAEI